MRRVLPFLFLAFALGCGGSGNSDGPRPTLRLAGTDDDELGGGLDASGGPALVAARSNGTVRVLTEAGLATFTVPAGIPAAEPRVLGDFVLIPLPNGTTILDRRTGTSRYDAGEFPGFSNGTQVVWLTNADPVAEDLATGVRTPIADADSVDAIRGGRIIVSKQTGTKNVEGFEIPVYTHYRQPLEGGTRIALNAPTGYGDARATFLDADGGALGTANAPGEGGGNDYPSSVIRWDSDATVSVPVPSFRGYPLAIRADGSVIAQDRASYRLVVLKGGQVVSLGLRGVLASASSDGTAVFVQSEEGDSIAAYRIP